MENHKEKDEIWNEIFDIFFFFCNVGLLYRKGIRRWNKMREDKVLVKGRKITVEDSGEGKREIMVEDYVE